MQLSISNIAWDPSEDDAVAALLAVSGIRHIDVAPNKYFPDPEAASAAGIAAVRAWWADRGIAVAGMQSLLFGSTGLNLFADDTTALLRRLAASCRIGRGLGASALTFGSPRQRDRGALSDAETERRAIVFLRALGDIAADAGVTIALEPVPAAYGCNFLTDNAETVAMIAAVDHPSIRLQLDIGAMGVVGEPVRETIERHAALVAHIHASEPGLATLGDGGADHAAAAATLRETMPDAIVTIEMVTSETRPHLGEIDRAVALAGAVYGAGA